MRCLRPEGVRETRRNQRTRVTRLALLSRRCLRVGIGIGGRVTTLHEGEALGRRGARMVAPMAECTEENSGLGCCVDAHGAGADLRPSMKATVHVGSQRVCVRSRGDWSHSSSWSSLSSSSVVLVVQLAAQVLNGLQVAAREHGSGRGSGLRSHASRNASSRPPRCASRERAPRTGFHRCRRPGSDETGVRRIAPSNTRGGLMLGILSVARTSIQTRRPTFHGEGARLGRSSSSLRDLTLLVEIGGMRA
jgi:hypothetical protein